MLLSEWMEQAVRNQPLWRGSWGLMGGPGCLLTATAREMGFKRRPCALEVLSFLGARFPALSVATSIPYDIAKFYDNGLTEKSVINFVRGLESRTVNWGWDFTRPRATATTPARPESAETASQLVAMSQALGESVAPVPPKCPASMESAAPPCPTSEMLVESVT